MTENNALRRHRLQSLSNRINWFLTQIESNRRPLNRRERYHLVDALQHLYEGRSEDGEAAIVRAERVEPLPPHLTAQPVPSDTVTADNLREGLNAVLSRQEGGMKAKARTRRNEACEPIAPSTCSG